VNRPRNKGTRAETAIVNYLLDQGISAKRLALRGKDDQGDIEVDAPVLIEAKNCKTMQLAQWVDSIRKKAQPGDVAVVWHHRPRKSSPAEWYVTMSGSDFVRILKILVDQDAMAVRPVDNIS